TSGASGATAFPARRYEPGRAGRRDAVGGEVRHRQPGAAGRGDVHPRRPRAGVAGVVPAAAGPALLGGEAGIGGLTAMAELHVRPTSPPAAGGRTDAAARKAAGPSDDKIHTWPHLVRSEFLCAVFMIMLLTVWSLLVDAPLEEPANPTRTPN